MQKAVDSADRASVSLSSVVAGWSSLVARQAHNLKVAGSNPAPAPNLKALVGNDLRGFFTAQISGLKSTGVLK